MIYCPACKKPSARHTGNCPHCGFQFNQPRASDAGNAHTAATDSPSRNGFGGADIELDDMDGHSDAPLDLAIEQASAIPSAGPPGIHLTGTRSSESAPTGNSRFGHGGDRFDTDPDNRAIISEIAGFGAYGSGLVEIMKYGLRVYRRLPALRDETETVRKEKDACWERLDATKASLGRQAAKLRTKEPSLEKLITKAERADGKLENVQREEEVVHQRFGEKLAVITGQLDALESEKAPISEEALRTRNHHEQTLKERSRLNAKIKRTEIELRNIRERIEQKQSLYADLKQPREDRARLLQEITELDHRQAPLLHRLSIEQKELTATDAPFETISAQLTRINERLDEFNQRTSRLQQEQRQLESEQQSALDAIHNKARGESRHAQAAWASVGEMAYVNRLLDSAALSKVQSAAETFFETQKKLTLYEAALESYDNGTYQQARKLWIAAALTMGILVLVLTGMVVF